MRMPELFFGNMPFNWAQFMRDMDVLTSGCMLDYYSDYARSLEDTYGRSITKLRELYEAGKYMRGDFLEKPKTERAKPDDVKPGMSRVSVVSLDPGPKTLRRLTLLVDGKELSGVRSFEFKADAHNLVTLTVHLNADSINIKDIEADVHKVVGRALGLRSTGKVIDQGPFGHWHECYEDHQSSWGVIGYR